MIKKYIPLILYHTNINFIVNEVVSIKKLFKKSYILNYQDFFNNNGDLFLKRKILKYIDLNNVNSLIIFSHNDNFQISLDFLKNIKDKVKIVFNFKDDGTNTFIYSRYYSIISDATITNCEYANTYYKSLNINSFLSRYTLSNLSSDTLSNKRLRNSKKKYDISFVGSFLKNDRKEFIEYIKKENLSYFFLDTSKDQKKISQKKYYNIIRVSKINLNFSSTGDKKYNFFKNTDPFINHSYSPKHRIEEAGLNKGFILSEYASELRSSWKKNEIVLFYDKKEMINKIFYYLKNKKRRDYIADNLYKKCIKRVTFNNILIKKVFESLNKKISPVVSQDKINLSNYKKLEATFLLLYVLKMLKNLKFKAIIFTLNRFLSLNFTNIFHAPIHLIRYFYYFYLK
jgi:hypothetical protein